MSGDEKPLHAVRIGRAGFDDGETEMTTITKTYGGLNDTVKFGGESDNYNIYTYGGSDVIYTGTGNDTVWGGSDNDTIYADRGSNVLKGEGGDDYLYSGGEIIDAYGDIYAASFLSGGDGQDTLSHGGQRFDTLDGGAGDDLYILHVIDNHVPKIVELAGGGHDTVAGTFGSGSQVVLADQVEDFRVDQIEWFKSAYEPGNTTWDKTDGTYDGSAGAGGGVNLTANALHNVITMSDRDDTVHAGLGNDTVQGGVGADKLYGDGGNDWMSGGRFNDTLDGGDGHDRLYGDADNDALYGSNGNDTLNGGTGADTLAGGYGNDTYEVADADSIVELAGQGIDTVNVLGLTSWTLAANVENLTFVGSVNPMTARLGVGNALGNNITGEGANDTLRGMDGNDALTGGGGQDSLDGGNGNDWVYGGDGADTLRGGAGTDFLYGNNGADKVYGGDGNDQVYGNDGNDQVVGDAGNDIVGGGAGNDTVSGGAGLDTVYGDAGSDMIYGSGGADQLWGGAGVDYFSYTSTLDSNKYGIDVIKDFEKGVDKINLHPMDANQVVAGDGNQDFHFTGTGAMFTSAGDVWIKETATDTLVYADVNGDATADFIIFVEGVTGLTATDFIL